DVGRVRADQPVGQGGAADELLDVGEPAGLGGGEGGQVDGGGQAAVGRVVEGGDAGAAVGLAADAARDAELEHVRRRPGHPGVEAGEPDPVDVAGVGPADGPGVGDVGGLEGVADAVAGDGRAGELGGRQHEGVVAAGAAVEDVLAAARDDDVAGGVP